MAAALRFAFSPGRAIIARNSLFRRGNRPISTSNKSKDTVVTEIETSLKQKQIGEASETSGEKSKNWISYGFSELDEHTDRFIYKLAFFFSITVGLIGGTFILAYQPDYMMHDWAQRESYLELNRRERLGLPLIDRNLIDPSKIELPSEEELGDTEIYI